MKHHLLMVDDEAPTRELYSLYLRTHGFDVTTAASSEEALELVKKTSFQVCLLDLGLGPKSDGMDLVEPFKKAQPRMAILIYTGRAFDETLREKALKKGAAGFLSKTQPLDQLLLEIKRNLAG
jgi:DNA-binding NtrC family response regulator